MSALLYFDFSRCRKWLWIWWAFCVVQGGMGIGYLDSSVEDLPNMDALMLMKYFLLAIFIGMLIQPAHPGHSQSFFKARPLEADEILGERLVIIIGLLLLPLFLAGMLPLWLVEPGFETVTAYSVHFWGIHLGVSALLCAAAASCTRASSFLLRAVLGAVLLVSVANGFKIFSARESNWIEVASPDRAELLWRFGLAMTGALVFGLLTRALYRGARSWRIPTLTMILALVLAAAWMPIKFRTDLSKVGYPVPTETVDAETLVYTAGRSRWGSGYEMQRNRKPGSYGNYVQQQPPYWKNREENFWFTSGQIEVEGLDPEIAYSARMLEARWIAPGGERVDYDPPAGTFSVRNSGFTIPPPSPTSARLDTLLGPASEEGVRHDNSGKISSIHLFGAWTSVYEKYKTTPGRLELKVRLDFYTHDTVTLPLSEPGTVGHSPGKFYLAEVSFVGDKLHIGLLGWMAAKRWQTSLEDRWQSWNHWRLYDPKTGFLGRHTGGSTSNRSLFDSWILRRSSMSFDTDIAGHEKYPDLSQYRSLQLVNILPRYLGSAEVEVIVKDFPLVTEKSIKNAGRND